jgi:hypothetical protein
VLAALLVAAFIATSSSAQDGSLDLQKADARFICADGTRAIWWTSELIEATRKYRAPSFIHRFYRQRIGERTAVLIHTTRDTRVIFSGALMADGTFVLHHRSRMLWIAEGDAVTTSEEPIRVYSLYPDGVILRFLRPQHGKQTYFVPFEGNSLDVEAKVAIPDSTCRHESRFAWIADGRLHVYELKSKEETTVRLEAELHPSQKVTAFDGETVMASVHAFDVKTGHLCGEKEYPRRPSHLAHVFAVRNRIGYFIEEGTLFATDLDSSTGQPTSLLAAGKTPFHFQDAKGIRIWNGKEWILVEWLKTMPDGLENAEPTDPDGG